MKFTFGTAMLQNKKQAQKNCYLLTNGLGGFSSATIIQSMTRNDHALFMASIVAPDIRYHLVSKTIEEIKINNQIYDLSSQDYVDHTKNQDGHNYLVHYQQESFPTWVYLVEGIEIQKQIVMEHNHNTVTIQYKIDNPFQKEVTLQITPCLQFIEKGHLLSKEQPFEITPDKVVSNGITMYIQSNHNGIQKYKESWINDYYYCHDARDGRDSYGATRQEFTYLIDASKSSTIYELTFSLDPSNHDFTTIKNQEIKRLDNLVKTSNIKSPLGKQLIKATDQFIVARESTKGKTIIAGYPFFGDWGRDTMYAIEGCCLTTKRFEDAKEILRTFTKYLYKGMMPNMFPIDCKQPLYNTVDASLLFIQVVDLYYKYTNDLDFVEEMYDAMASIIDWYKKGTDFDIKMDDDGLLLAGSGVHQVTWMDIAYEGFLPTPRHGKPVEINSYWYNALCVVAHYSKQLHKEYKVYQDMALKTKQSFQEKFWNEEKQCLKDVVSNNPYDTQIRCNQIWAVSVEYSPLTSDQAKKVVQCVYEKLYTPYGLRSLEINDDEFVGEYSGSLKKRDLSYHQGTVWTFPLGSYFRAYLKVNNYSNDTKEVVKKQLGYIQDCLYEGCLGQIAEIYDGLYPGASRGCFGQAWSVAEIVKIIEEVM